MLKANFHTHTTLCDGADTPEAMADEALRKGFTHLGFSGHMDPDIHMDMDEYTRQISALQKKHQGKMDILMGIELDTMYDPAYAARAEYVIGSTHFLDVECNRGYRHVSEGQGTAASRQEALAEAAPAASRQEALAEAAPAASRKEALAEAAPAASRKEALAEAAPAESRQEALAEAVTSAGRPRSVDACPEDLQLLADTYFGGDFYRLAKNYYETEAQVYDRLRCTFVGHFDLVVKFNDQMHFLDESDPRYLGPALETMEYLVREGMPFEINCGAVNRGRKKELYPNRNLLRHLREMGGAIVISSDAHRKELLDGAFDQAVRTAISCGFTHTGILEHGPDGRVRFCQIPLDTLL